MTNPSESLSPAEREKQVQKVKAWIKSPEGQKELADALDRADAACEALRRAREIPWQLLHQPMTI